jgi:hypothetical protein
MRFKTKKPPKYHNKKVVIGDIVFDSKKEAARWFELLILQQAGQILGLELKPRFKLTAGIIYIPDFCYIENSTNIAEDVKGCRTAVFNLKKRLFEHCYPDWTLRLT